MDLQKRISWLFYKFLCRPFKKPRRFLGSARECVGCMFEILRG